MLIIFICSYVHSGIELIVQYGKPVVDMLDRNIESVVGKAASVKNGLISRYNSSKEEVIIKAKGYKSAITEQVSNSGLKTKVEESVRQAPEMVRSLSTKAVSLTKQGLEISIGHEKTESVINTVKTHTPKFVSSFLETEPADVPVNAAVAEPSSVPATVAAH